VFMMGTLFLAIKDENEKIRGTEQRNRAEEQSVVSDSRGLDGRE